MRKWFFLISTFLVSVSLLVPTVGYFLFPIYPWSEKLTTQNGIFILSKAVKENLHGLTYYSGEIFYKNQKVGNFSTLSLKRFPIPSFQWKCEKGNASVVPKFGFLKISFSRFGCILYAKSVSGNLKLLRREIYGKLTLKGVKIPNLPVGEINSLEINFQGKKFTAVTKVGGETVKGSGTLKFDLLKLNQAKIEATFSGAGFHFNLRGPLFNPQVVW